MREFWFALRMDAAARPVVILDASESAKPHWMEMKQLLIQLFQGLPAHALPDLYFLGNPEPFDASQFGTQSEKWYKANVGRGSVIGPILERLPRESPPPIFVLGNGLIFDLPDWKGTPVGDAAFYGRLGDEPITGGLYPEPKPTVDNIKRKMHNPVTAVEIGGSALLPFFWDNPAYTWAGDKLAAKDAPTYAVRVGFLGPDEAELQAFTVQADNSRKPLPLQQLYSPPDLPPRRKFSEAEDSQLRQAIRQGDYACPACKKRHPLDVLRCPAGGADSKPWLPTLSELPARTFAVIFMDTPDWRAEVQPHPGPVFKFPDDSIALRTEAGLRLFRFDPISQTWAAQPDKVRDWSLLEESTYAVVL